MEMSRGHFVGAFVLFILMLSTTQAFPRNKEDSSNSVPDDADYKELQCLFVDTKLPICDPKWWSNSSGEFINNRTNSVSEPSVGENRVLRKRSIVEIAPNTRIVVYAFKNCLFTEPDRLRFLMPFCEDVMRSDHYDKIVRVELFEPFVIEGLKKPPYFFPSRPKRPITNRRDRVPAENDEGREHMRTTSKKAILNGFARSMNVASSSRLVSGSSGRKLAEPMDEEGEVMATSSGRNASRENISRGTTIVVQSRNFAGKFSDEADRRQTSLVDRRKPSAEEEPTEEDPLAILAIPKAPTTPGPPSSLLAVGKSMPRNSANEPANRGDSDDLLLGPGPQTAQNSNGGGPDDPLTSSEIVAKNLRRTRETKTTEASSR